MRRAISFGPLELSAELRITDSIHPSNSDMADPPKLKSTEFFTEDQLQRKRELDRKSQRLARERTKAQIHNLELRVLQLEHQNQDLEQKLASCRCHNELRAPLALQQPLVDSDLVNHVAGIDFVQLFGKDQGMNTWHSLHL
jgi:hypothetical protein